MPTSAEKFIRDNGAKVHDRVKIEAKDLTYEGLILPKNNFSKDDIIVIKLDNGYNLGVSVEDAKLTILSKAEKKQTSIKNNLKSKDLVFYEENVIKIKSHFLLLIFSLIFLEKNQ